jgi:signal transduction histidine kinase
LEASTPKTLNENSNTAFLRQLQALVRESVDCHAICEHSVKGIVQLLDVCGCQLRIFNSEATLTTALYEYVCDRDEVGSFLVYYTSFPDTDAPNINPIVEAKLTHDHPAPPVFTFRYPLISQMEVLGELMVHREARENFDADVLDLLDQVGTYCAIGLRQMRFLRVTQTQSIELKRLNQLQDTFLNTVSYELRIPLSNIKMSIQMLSLALHRSDEADALTNALTNAEAPFTLEALAYSKVSRYLEVLQKECDREIKLIQDLLDLQQLDNETVSLLVSSIDIPQWLTYIVNPFQKRFQEHNISYKIDIESDLPPLICDQNSLSRIMVELLNNAHRYTPSGENIRVHAFQQKGTRSNSPTQLHLQVINSGVEIPLEERSKVFGKFYRIPRLDIRKLGGTGLGLALVKNLTLRLGGEVKLESGGGATTFTVILPFQSVRS